MDLLNGIDTIINLENEYNGVDIAITPNGGDIRFIDLTRKNKAEMSSWVVRTAEDVLAVTAGTYLDFDCVEASILRQGEYVAFYDAGGDCIGGGVISVVDGTNVKFTTTKGSADMEFANIASIKLHADPFLLDGRTKPIKTTLFKFLILQANADLELGVEILQVGNCI